MNRQALMKASVALIFLISALGIGGYSGYLLGRDVQLQESLYCTAGHTRTYVHLLEDLKSNDITRAAGLIETNVDAGVILLTLAPEKTFEHTAGFVRETLTLVRDHRQKHPWTGGSPELKERVSRALANAR
jgi:hypothetical protein